jgi:hypothetical protein
MKLLIKVMRAKAVDNSITATLTTAVVLTLSIALNKGFKSPIKTNKVSVTARCEINLFSFLIPKLNNNNIIPKITGISAVMGLDSKFK